MAYSTQRYFINNLANAYNITAASSSQATGTIAGAQKTGTGTATLTPSGGYTGANDRLYTIQCDGAGTVGSGATYRWRTSDTAVGSWEATGVASSTAVVSLSAGFQFQFTAGTLVLYDKWQAWAYASFGPGNMFVNDRDKYWKTANLTSISYVIDLGSAQTVTACILADHNLTAAAVVTLYGNATDSWGAPSYTNIILNSANTDPSVDYFSESYRYWKVTFVDAANPDGFMSIGKFYLGTYTEFTETGQNVSWGSSKSSGLTRIRTTSEAGKIRGRVYSEKVAFDTLYKWLNSTDLALFQTVWNATFDTDTGQDNAIWIHYWYDTENTCYLCRCMSESFAVTYKKYQLHEVSLSWEQEAITRVI